MPSLYIVTGANGHLGNTIVRMLMNQNHIVRGLILPSDSNSMLLQMGVEVFKGDVRIIETLEPLFDMSTLTKQVDHVYVIHTAGIVSITTKRNPMIEDVNVNGTKHMVDLSHKYKVDRFIYVSSVHAIPEKKSNGLMTEITHFDANHVHGLYAKTKSMATQYVLDTIKKGLNGIVVHPSGIIGPNDYGRSHMTMMIIDYLNGKLTSRINGAYDFVDVRDVAKGIIQSTVSGVVGKCYILSGHHVTLKKLFEQLQLMSGKKNKIHVLPMWFAKLTAPLAEFYYKLRKLPPIYTKYSLYTLESNSNFSNKLAYRELNYQPRSLDETLDDTIKWLVEEHRIKKSPIIHFIKTYKPIKKI